jgi:NACHT domain
VVDDYTRVRHLRLENTCEWINQEPKYLSWKGSSRRNVELWVRGPPGCGKSTLAAAIIEQLSMDRATAYFFCNIEDPDRSNFTGLLRTLTWQLVLKKPHLADGIYNIYLETAGATTPIDSYKRALASLLKDGEPCYVIIDGLDECRGKHTDIQKVLFHISSHAKLLIISRWETWIQQCFHIGQMTPVLAIETTHNYTDLKRFVNIKIQDLDLEPALAAELALLLTSKAKGMFLWVKLTIEYLSQQATLEDTIQALKDLPEGLEPLYERLLSRLRLLPQSRYKLACKLIQWTFSSFRPLSLEQLKVALSITPGDDRPKHPNNILNLEKFVRESCGPLLEHDKAKSTIRFVHSSAVDFLSHRTPLNPQFDLGGDELTFIPNVANPYCASVCLTYLSVENIEFVPEDKVLRVYSRNLDRYLARYPFMHYCVLNWWKHLPLPQSDSGRITQALGNAIKLFTSSQKCIVRWMQLFQLLDGLHEEEGVQATLFRSPKSLYAWRFNDEDSLFHHLWLAPSGLFTRWQRWRTEIFFNGRYATPMGIASFFDLLDIVKAEFKVGKDINERDPIGLTSALLAALGEAPNVLQYAIENGADMALTSPVGYGIVRYATRNSISILSKVIDAGAAVGAATLDDGTTSIQAACTSAGFHPSILPQLLKHALKGDLDAKGFSGRTALHLAAAIKIESYTHLVFDRGLITAGALPQHHRLHTGATEEAFMPSTLAEVENWLQSWSSYFATESNGADSESLTCRTSNFNEDKIARLVRNIKASMIIWLVSRGASIVETDNEGRTALDIVLLTGFAEDMDVIDDYCLKRLSRALTALGAMDADSKGSEALEKSLMRGHWVTVKAILKGDMATSKLSENDRRFISTTLNQTEAHKESTPGVKKQYQPQSLAIALHSSFILRFCLKKHSRSSAYDELTYLKLSTLIIDFAEYWVKSSDSVTSSEGIRFGSSLNRPSTSRNTVGVSVPLAGGELRKISIQVFRPGPHRRSYSCHRRTGNRYANVLHNNGLGGGLSQISGVQNDHDVGTINTNLLRNSTATDHLARRPILEMIRQPAERRLTLVLDHMKQGLGFEQKEAIMVPSNTFALRHPGLLLDECWEQTWRLPVDLHGRADVSPGSVIEFLLSLSPQDEILLRPTQDFFANDVALYGGFSIEIYCAGI